MFVQLSVGRSFISRSRTLYQAGVITVKTPSQTLRKQFMSSDCNEKFLSVENINPNFVKMEYAVRGPVLMRANEIEEELKQGAKKPFKQVIRANAGDPQAMGQKPITFLRQLIACVFDPSLLESNLYPEDVKEHACEIINGCDGKSIGAYTQSAGIEVIRKQVAKFFEDRDGVPADWTNIYMTAGGTPGIKSVLALLTAKQNGQNPGIMVPIPQYPLYSATIAEYGLEKIGYYLDECNNWGLDVEELQRAYDEGKCNSHPSAIVVINPGNPTGQVLTLQNIEDIIKFAHKNKLVIIADEVYQNNVHDPDSKFYSFKKVTHDMGSPYKDMELFSFMSTSKGFLGECGVRGGSMEMVNLSPEVQAVLAKSITSSLCATTAGQTAMSALVNPPKCGEPSYELYVKERDAIVNALKERAELIYKTLNSFEGFTLNVVQGALYAFPRIDIPPKAIEAAKAKNMVPDVFYTFELLENTGICIIPGSGFGQEEGTHHFRTTIVPPTDQMKLMMEIFGEFHRKFMEQYK